MDAYEHTKKLEIEISPTFSTATKLAGYEEGDDIDEQRILETIGAETQPESYEEEEEFVIPKGYEAKLTNEEDEEKFTTNFLNNESKILLPSGNYRWKGNKIFRS